MDNSIANSSRYVFDVLERAERMRDSDELIVDLFAGGGGASLGIELAIGMSPHIAVNHDPEAIAMHEVNHPDTIHYTASVFEVDPYEVTRLRIPANDEFINKRRKQLDDIANGRLRRYSKLLGCSQVGFLWASPDCTHFTIARGQAPVSPRIRSLAWVILRWAGTVAPRVIMCENVKEIQTWGPLVAKRDKGTGRVLKKDGSIAAPGERVPVQEQQLVPDKKRSGKTYRKFIALMKEKGYDIETNELVAADYGIPTIRKRWFMIARRDGEKIVWPEKTHAKKSSPEVLAGEKKAWVPVSRCIDWSLPAYSIFLTKQEVRDKKLPCRRPLAEATMDRIGKGVDKFVLNNPSPFIVHVQNTSSDAVNSIDEPIRTITASPKGGGMAIAIPFMAKHYSGATGHDLDAPLGTVTTIDHHSLVMASAVITNTSQLAPTNIGEPLPTITTGSQQALCTAQMSSCIEDIVPDAVSCAAHVYRDFGQSIGSDLNEPIGTITASGNGKAGIVMSFMTKLRGQNIGDEMTEPLGTVTAGGQHHGIVSAFMVRYHGSEKGGHPVDQPIGTITSKDEFGLIQTIINGKFAMIVDILFRMLAPRELYRAQGFPDWYIIEYGIMNDTVVKFSTVAQVRMVGNSVPPPLAAAIIKENYIPQISLIRT